MEVGNEVVFNNKVGVVIMVASDGSIHKRPDDLQDKVCVRYDNVTRWHYLSDFN